jgi:DUF971 family protein
MVSSQPKVIRQSDPKRVEIEWSDGHHTVYSATELRGICPCAECVSETTGQRIHDPASVPEALEQSGMELVGNYAVSLVFSDGHSAGIFTFDFLRRNDPSLRLNNPEKG